MKISEISADFAVSPQISPADLVELKKAGFRSVICNRPDGEGPGQPSFEQIRTAAEVAGVEVRYVPVKSGEITEQNLDAFGLAMDELPSPVLAYCLSGKRAAILWALNEAPNMLVSDIISLISKAGYDIAALKPWLEKRSKH